MSNIPKAWIHAVQSGQAQLVDPAKSEYADPFETPEYQAFVEEMAKECRCEPCSARPCDGVLAGGLCDRMDWRERDDFQDGNEEEPFCPI